MIHSAPSACARPGQTTVGLIPCGLWSCPRNPASPLELAPDRPSGRMRLHVALDEMAQAGICRVLLALSTRRFGPEPYRRALASWHRAAPSAIHPPVEVDLVSLPTAGGTDVLIFQALQIAGRGK